MAHSAFDNWIKFVDTPDVYAQDYSDEFIGRSLKGLRVGMPIGTKFGNTRRQGPIDFGGAAKLIIQRI